VGPDVSQPDTHLRAAVWTARDMSILQQELRDPAPAVRLSPPGFVTPEAAEYGGGVAMDSLVKDVSHALRALARYPAFAAAAVLTLALGIGANTAIFSVVHGILLRPLPYPGADRIVMVWNENLREGIERDVTSFPNFADWRASGDVFDALASYSHSGTATLTDGDEPEQVGAASVTADFLSVFGSAPALGRGFAEDEMQPGSADVVLLSAALWERRFGGDPAIIGRAISLNGRMRTVVGVMPASFDYPAGTDLWVPLAPTGPIAEARGALWLSVVGRVRAGVSLEQAQQRMSAVAAQLEQEYPGPNTGAGIMLEPLQQTITGDVRAPLLILLAAVAVVLLIGCANVANLLLARGTVRRRELAIRAALGAGRGRVARQLLTESVMLALVGGIIGVGLAVWAVGGIISLAPPDLPRVEAIRIDTAVLGFTLFVSIVTGLLFGLAPLLQTRRMDVASGLRQEGRSIGDREGMGRLRPALIGGEVALAFVLLVAAGLLLRSFAALSVVDPGFDTERALTFRITLPAARYDSGERVEQAHAELLERVRSVAGVRSAGAASTLFLSRLPDMAPITLEGDAPLADDVARESVVAESATPGFFDALGMRLVRGRDIDRTDDQQGTRTTVVNEAFVRRYLPDT
jgi:putative ABC transport system permease protein